MSSDATQAEILRRLEEQGRALEEQGRLLRRLLAVVPSAVDSEQSAEERRAHEDELRRLAARSG